MTKDNKDKYNGGWRYQAVYAENNNEMGGTYCGYTICEVYLDKDGSLETWTEKSSIAPSGETVDELTNDLQLMLNDIAEWKPVPFESLYIGMVFERNEFCVKGESAMAYRFDMQDKTPQQRMIVSKRDAEEKRRKDEQARQKSNPVDKELSFKFIKWFNSWEKDCFNVEIGFCDHSLLRGLIEINKAITLESSADKDFFVQLKSLLPSAFKDAEPSRGEINCCIEEKTYSIVYYYNNCELNIIDEGRKIIQTL